MNDDAQILIARLLTHQTLRRDDKMVKKAVNAIKEERPSGIELILVANLGRSSSRPG